MRTRDRSRWGLVFGSAVCLVFSTGPVVQFTFGAFVKPVAVGLKTNRATVSVALLIALWIIGILTPAVGRLADRFGSRRVALPAIVLLAVAIAGVGFGASTITRFIVFYALLGVAGAAHTPLIYARAISGAFTRDRGLALGFAMAGVGVGTALLPRLVQWLVSAAGWQVAYITLGVVILSIALPAAVVFLEDSQTTALANPDESPNAGLTPAEAIRSYTFWILASAFALVAFALAGIMTHLVPMMTDHGISDRIAGVAMTGGGIAMIGGRLVAGYLLDRVFAPRVALVFFVLPLLGVLILLSSAGVGSTVVAAVLVGLGLGAEIDLVAYLQSRYLGMRRFGEIYGLLFALFMLGAGLGPYVLGQVYNHSGSYAPALVGCAASLSIACGLTFALGPYCYGPAATARRMQFARG